MTKKGQHVVPCSSGAWAVRRTGAERASKVFATQVEAVNHARLIACKEQAELYVHNKDGTVLSKSSDGQDQIRPRGKK